MIYFGRSVPTGEGEHCREIEPFCAEVAGQGQKLSWLNDAVPMIYFGRSVPTGEAWDGLSKVWVPSAPRTANDRHLHFSALKFKQLSVDLRKGLSAQEAVTQATCVLDALECSKINWKPYYALL